MQPAFSPVRLKLSGQFAYLARWPQGSQLVSYSLGSPHAGRLMPAMRVRARRLPLSQRSKPAAKWAAPDLCAMMDEAAPPKKHGPYRKVRNEGLRRCDGHFDIRLTRDELDMA